jgi:hypothetical protein
MHRKKTKFSKHFQDRLKSKKARNSNAADSGNRFIQKIKDHTAGEGIIIQDSTTTASRMSEIIIHYASPLLESAEPGTDREKALIAAITLWNLTLIPEDRRQGMLSSTLQEIYGKEYPADSAQLLEYFTARKESLYPELSQVILDYDYIQTPEGDNLNVVSNADQNNT